jgi:WD40 repeat protein
VMGGGDVAWEESGTVLGVAFSGDGRSLAAACEDGSALIWDAAACTPSATTPWPSGHPQSVGCQS